MSAEYIQVAEAAGIVTITLNRPEKMNAFVGRMRRDLAEALEQAGGDMHVRVVVLRGEGRAFCAGGDVGVMAELMQRGDTDEFARMLGAGRRVVQAIRQMTKPVLASIGGAATGAGFNLALACDLRIAGESARFSQSFVKVGLHPDWGGTYFLPRLVPPNIACEMFFLGDAIEARRALELGLVNRVVPDDQLAAETQRLAERLRAAPPESIAAAKHAVYLSHHAELEEMLQYETEAQLRCFQTADAREGVRAFLEKRPPRFNSP
ncbi:MAG TPA: enoyl-CoA hydratase [Pyrinomonadaceae bacterium]|jgi:2-(1,2-epoxy-1,2-dihydrophenyl)acetyl-CoA isomerase